MALVGFCGSRNLPPRWRKLVADVVYAVARADRAIAVGCAQGADAMALRQCFTPTWALRAPMVQVFVAFGPNGQGDGEWSATPLVQNISRLPMAMARGDGGMRVVVNWWAGGDSSVDWSTRLKARSDTMVSAVAASGEGRGLIAFVTAGPGQSPGTWRTIRQAYKRGLPVVVFSCGCTLRSFPSLGEGRWTTAGSGVWSRGWKWVKGSASTDEEEPNPIFRLLGWKPLRPSRKRVELDFPLMLNLRRWLYQRDQEVEPNTQGGVTCQTATIEHGGDDCVVSR